MRSATPRWCRSAACFFTAACDVQENPPRLEVEIKARGRENWSMGYWVLQAFAANGQELPVSAKELWDALDELLYRDWQHESGRTLSILAICIDTGRNPKPVYEFANITSSTTGRRALSS
jgi:phage terminase large subunit GpA-like protein